MRTIKKKDVKVLFFIQQAMYVSIFLRIATTNISTTIIKKKKKLLRFFCVHSNLSREIVLRGKNYCFIDFLWIVLRRKIITLRIALRRV